MGTNNIVQKLKNENIVQKLKNEEQLKAQAKKPKDSKNKRWVKKKPSASQKKVAKKPASLVSIKTRTDGTVAVTGKPSNLQMSGIYPVQYALAICQLQWPAHFVD